MDDENLERRRDLVERWTDGDMSRQDTIPEELMSQILDYAGRIAAERPWSSGWEKITANNVKRLQRILDDDQMAIRRKIGLIEPTDPLWDEYDRGVMLAFDVYCMAEECRNQQ